MESIIDKIRSNSNPKLSQPKRVQYFLVGEPGTGKTTFVEELGKVLGLPVCKVSLAMDMKPTALGGMSLVNGDSSDKAIVLSASESHYNHIGHIPQQLIESGVSNPIIFMDEASESLQESHSTLVAMMKKLTDPNKKELVLDYGGIKIDWSRATLILAGNMELVDSALRSRFPTVRFPALNKEQKTAAARSALENALDVLKETEVPDEIIVQITQDMEKHLEFIINENGKAHDGARELMTTVDDMVSYFKGLRMDDILFTDDDAKTQIMHLIEASRKSDDAKEELGSAK